MKLSVFRGGVHPFEGKDISKDKPVKAYFPRGELVYPLSQHIGAPAKAVVTAGDEVLVGQVLAEAKGYVSANVISSVSGRVKAIEQRLLPSGKFYDSIIVENDNTYRPVEGFGSPQDAQRMTKDEIRAAIRNAGIVGMGGAGFPTHVKLTPEDDARIQYVIVNGAECEPYLTSDYRLMLEEPERLLKGLQIVLKLFENARGVIAVEDNKPEAVRQLKKAAAANERIAVVPLKTKYPQGAERNLVYAVTGRRQNSRKLPADLGCIVCNTNTVIAIEKAVGEQTPLISRVVTVTGEALRSPGNFRVPIGTCFRELVDAAGGFSCEPVKMIAGGPMMGSVLTTLDVPVTKTSSALLALTRDDTARWKPGECIRCGRCAAVCPCGLIPQKMREACERNDLELFERLYGMECYECGSCTYICPAKLYLTQSFKVARNAVIMKRKKEQAANQA